MKVTRFCSKKEYEKFMSGEVLVNTTDHFKEGKGGSTSKGFCFTTDDPKTAWRYLSGIVDYEICMVLNIPRARLKESRGKYINEEGTDVCYKTEWCITKYSKHSAQLLEVLRSEDFATPEELKALEIYKSIKPQLGL